MDRPDLIHAADRLLAAIERTGTPACVGIDPVIERLPAAIRPTGTDGAPAVGAIGAFCRGLLEAIAPCVPCVKFQSACFERYGPAGQEVLDALMARAKALGLEVILDVKRGDIGTTATHYASAAFDRLGDASPDWITVNSYLGEDGIRPFLRRTKGVFALVRTSNPSADSLQDMVLRDGSTVAEAVARQVARLGADSVGERGFSNVGAVVAATRPQAAAVLRELMPQQFFLIPGFGAQGAEADDVIPCFRPDGTGGIVTASRSVIYAFDPDDSDWPRAVSSAAAQFAQDVARAAGVT